MDKKDQPIAELSRLIIDGARQLQRAGDKIFTEKCGITVSEKDVLFQLKRAKGELRMSDLSRSLIFTDGGATKLIKRLVEAGLVERSRSKEDLRVVLVRITPEGSKKLAEVFPVLKDLVKGFFSNLDSEDVKTAVAALRKLDLQNDNG